VAALALSTDKHNARPASQGQLFQAESQGGVASLAFDQSSGQVEWSTAAGQHYITTLADPSHDAAVVRRLAGKVAVSTSTLLPQDLNTAGVYLEVALVYGAYLILLAADIGRRNVRRLPRWVWLLIAFLLPPWGAIAYILVEHRSGHSPASRSTARLATILAVTILFVWTVIWTPALLSVGHASAS